MTVSSVTVLLGLALSAPSPVPAQPADRNSLVFILDASGSMAAKSGGTTKMEAAKQVMIQLVGDLPPGVRAGLMAYGHRRKNDCGDVELLVPVEPLSKDRFTQTIKALQPLGQTPISDSIRQAADVLKGIPGRKAVILVSDGEETCKQDPCRVAADLKKADIDLKVHVVGFGLDTPAAKKQLQCVASATGGTYAEAGNAAELKSKISEAATAEVRPAPSGKLVSVIQDIEGGAIKYGISFYRPGSKATDDPLNSTMTLGMQLVDSVHELNVPPGTYDLLYTTLFAPSLWRRNVDIKSGQTTRVEFPRFGRARVSIRDQNGQSVNMYTEVKDGTPQENDLIGDHRFKQTLDLPAGVYDLKFWTLGLPETWRKGVVVKSGQETPVAVTVRVGK